MITATKVFDFCYAHFLPEYEGKCRNMHGHNSQVEVEFQQDPHIEKYAGMVIDFGTIKKIVGPIINSLDHRFLNEHKEFQEYCAKVNSLSPFYIQNCIPTAELICGFLVENILKEMPTLCRLRITETPDNWVEWRKD